MSQKYFYFDLVDHQFVLCFHFFDFVISDHFIFWRNIGGLHLSVHEQILISGWRYK